MPDPTEIAIIATFCSSLGIFAMAVICRKLLRPNTSLPMEVGAGSFDGVAELPFVGEILDESVVSDPLTKRQIPIDFYRTPDLLGLGLIFVLFFNLALASVRSPEKESLTLDPSLLLSSIAFQLMSAGMVIFFVYSRIRPVAWLGLKWSSWPWVFLIAPCAVLLIWLLLAGLQVVGYMDWISSFGVETTQDTVKILQESKDPTTLALMGIAAIVAAPVCEEIVFRGYVYPAMKSFSGPWVAGICTSLIFTAAHCNLAALLPLFIFGGLLAFVYEKTGSIWAPIAVHCAFNSATVATQLLARYDKILLGFSP